MYHLFINLLLFLLLCS